MHEFIPIDACEGFGLWLSLLSWTVLISSTLILIIMTLVHWYIVPFHAFGVIIFELG